MVDFTTKELASLVLLPVPTINSWVPRGAIRPARVGCGGRGNTHTYSAQQAFVLALLAEMLKVEFSDYGSRLGRIQVMNVRRHWNKISDDDIRRAGLQDAAWERMGKLQEANASK
jgi:hypothetical protein